MHGLGLACPGVRISHLCNWLSECILFFVCSFVKITRTVHSLGHSLPLPAVHVVVKRDNQIKIVSRSTKIAEAVKTTSTRERSTIV